MNTQRMKTLARTIREMPEARDGSGSGTLTRVKAMAGHPKPTLFNMGSWYQEEEVTSDDGICGTAACIAGHAAAMWPDGHALSDTIHEAGERALGIKSKAVSAALFAPAWRTPTPGGRRPPCSTGWRRTRRRVPSRLRSSGIGCERRDRHHSSGFQRFRPSVARDHGGSG